jgi:2-hydroxy-3-keto-5-methylthiopentenyl-1-phosphate phosphatase
LKADAPAPPRDPMNDPAPFRMLVDFDGTLVEPNVAIILVEEFCDDGRRVAHEIDEQLHAGQITLREAWSRQVALLDPKRLTEMADWAVRNTPFREGAKELLALLGRHQIPTTIVSGGLDFYIDPILRHAGIDLPVYSDQIRLNASGGLDLLHPYGHATCRLCGICKAQLTYPFPAPPLRTAFAGDGSTDRYAAEVADIVFARRRLKLYCDSAKIPYFPFEDFHPVIAQLVAWLEEGRPLPGPRRLGVASSECPISTTLAQRSASAES